MKQSTFSEANKLRFGYKRLVGNQFTVKVRVSNDIANTIIDTAKYRIAFKDLYITESSNKNCRFIFGVGYEDTVQMLQNAIKIGTANRLVKQAQALRDQVDFIENPDWGKPDPSEEHKMHVDEHYYLDWDM